MSALASAPAPGARPVTDRPSVTVVIPVKDDATQLRRCLRALSLQTRPADEVIVVDNGSTDASAMVAAGAGARLVRCDEPGIPAASSHGYDHAGGDLILRLDADCLPADTWIESIVRAFTVNPRVGVFTGGARFIDGPRSLRRSLAGAYLLAYAVITAPALGHLPLFGSNLAMRREVWQGVSSRVHRTDAELHDDLDLAFHLGEHARIRFLSSAPMGMSMRPFSDAAGMARRVTRGFRTVLVHWPHDFPPVRWVRLSLRRNPLIARARARARAGAEAGAGRR